MSLYHSNYPQARWELNGNIGSETNPVTFMIAPATGLVAVNGTPHALIGTAFVGTLNGRGYTIYLDIYDARDNGVTGFIGRSNGTVANITFQGSVQGRNIVGGVVGWNTAGQVSLNNTAGVLFPSSGNAAIFGRVVGVNEGGAVYPPTDMGIGYPPAATGTSFMLDGSLLPEADCVDCGYAPVSPEYEPADSENGDAAIKRPDDDEPDNEPDAKKPDDDPPDDDGGEPGSSRPEDEPNIEEPHEDILIG